MYAHIASVEGAQGDALRRVADDIGSGAASDPWLARPYRSS